MSNSDKIDAIEEFCNETAELVDVTLDNQVILAERLNELILYMDRLFNTGIKPLVISYREPDGD